MNNRIEKRIELKAPLSRVWRALTDYREFGQWFRVKVDGPFVPGEISRGQITYPGYEHLQWEVVVQKMEPERLFSFTWHPYAVDPKKDYSKEPTTLVEFRLEKTVTGTLLVLTESGFDKLPCRSPSRSHPQKRWRMGRANEEHREPCRAKTVATLWRPPEAPTPASLCGARRPDASVASGGAVPGESPIRSRSSRRVQG